MAYNLTGSGLACGVGTMTNFISDSSTVALGLGEALYPLPSDLQTNISTNIGEVSVYYGQHIAGTHTLPSEGTYLVWSKGSSSKFEGGISAVLSYPHIVNYYQLKSGGGGNYHFFKVLLRSHYQNCLRNSSIKEVA